MPGSSNAVATFVRSLTLFAAAALFAGGAFGQSIPPYVGSGPLLPLILQMPANSWLQVNANSYSDVWTPASREPLDNGYPQNPSKIILPWSSFAWDSNRGDIILYGGGHANYPGNDVYRWHSSNLQWERASLPSEIYNDPVAGFLAIDGVDNAPISSHTYDNNIFLPIVDRFQTWGGAAYNNGFFYVRVSETNPSTTRPTGPYLFNPNRADGNKVGGTTGSNVKRVDPTSLAGGQMWENRDIFLHIPTQALPGTHVNGCTGYAAEGGRDVVYAAASGLFGTTLDLYRYQLTDINNPSLDQSTQVGAYSVGVTGQTTCGYDPVRKLFVRTGSNTAPFQFWDLTTPGPTNADRDVQIESTIAGLQAWLSAQSLNIQNCGLEFDPGRGTFPLWCGAGVVWELHEPAAGNTTSGWTVTQRTPSSEVPPGIVGTGIMGKWHYAPYYDVFVGLEDPNEGQVWIYKPVGWIQPNPTGNALPSVSITSPAAGASFVPATPLSLTANASDSDGSVARVEYYANGVKLGQSTVAPYTVAWTPVLVGPYAIVAVAVDNVGGMAASPTINISVNATLTTVTLQRGLNAYAGASDTYLDNTARTTARGASTPLYVDPASYTPLLRFAIYQSEGGPVPDGAVLQSASLQLYKQSYDDTLQLNALLKPWVESQATWNLAQTGTSWSVGGAAGAGSDYISTPDDSLTPSFNPGWVAFDVTARVQQWASNSSVNYGWRMSQTTSGGNLKAFYSGEYTTVTLRPKLTITYSGGGTINAPPTVTLLTPAGGATTPLGGSFNLTASASDDGSVAKVEYYAGALKIGQATASPYSFVWTPGATGSYVLTAVATDNAGLTATSNAATVSVTASTGTTIVLQRGLNGYAGVSDAFLDRYLQTTVRGATTPLYLDRANYTPLVRFAVFQSEGGPVPDGSTIQSASLQLYKQSYDDTIRLNPLLKPWVESRATWLLSQTGVQWTTAGAAGAGSDYGNSADAVVSVPFNPGWVAFDVTARVRQWSSNSSTNFGWRLGSTVSPVNAKTFNSSEYTTDATLRPKLTVVYSSTAINAPPTATLLTPANGATIALGGSFTLTASASDVGGTVTKVEYFAGSVKIGQATTSPYTLVWTPSATGSYVLTALATDNAGATGTSNAATVTVTAAPTTTLLTSSANPSVAGASVTFTATVAGSNPTGSVNFKDGANSISGCSAVALAGSGNSRTAACSTSALTAATHSITAAYGGDAGNAASASAALSQVVNATTSINVALASNGAAASASSTYSSGFPVSAIINNVRTGANWGVSGGWNDNTPNVWPDWVQINFSGIKTINRVVVYTLQDNYTNPIEPTDTMTFSLYGITAFTVQGWNGSSWVSLGSVSSNNLVKRTVNFSAYTTNRIRINVTGSLVSYSRIVEVEAWGN
jgi:hypothetical protein